MNKKNVKLKIFNYGNELFADPYYKPSKEYSGEEYASFLKNIYNSIELNTADEKAAFKEIYDYFKDPSNLISKDILENLILLKNKFPKILDPLYNNLLDAYISNNIYYRGGSLNINQLNQFLYEPSKIFKFDGEEFKLNKAIINKQKKTYIYEGTGKKHFLSFSKYFDVAAEFAITPFYNKKILKKFLKLNRIPVIIGISGNDKNLILNPEFSDAVSPYYEDEVLHVSNRIKIEEIYIINGNKFLDIYNKYDENNFRMKIRNKLKQNISI